ncbi:MAG: hypothetical protein MHM6MM_005351 [Cercozoa sp. M6MM]
MAAQAEFLAAVDGEIWQAIEDLNIQGDFDEEAIEQKCRQRRLDANEAFINALLRHTRASARKAENLASARKRCEALRTQLQEAADATAELLQRERDCEEKQSLLRSKQQKLRQIRKEFTISDVDEKAILSLHVRAVQELFKRKAKLGEMIAKSDEIENLGVSKTVFVQQFEKFKKLSERVCGQLLDVLERSTKDEQLLQALVLLKHSPSHYSDAIEKTLQHRKDRLAQNFRRQCPAAMGDAEGELSRALRTLSSLLLQESHFLRALDENALLDKVAAAVVPDLEHVVSRVSNDQACSLAAKLSLLAQSCEHYHALPCRVLASVCETLTSAAVSQAQHCHLTRALVVYNTAGAYVRRLRRLSDRQGDHMTDHVADQAIDNSARQIDRAATTLLLQALDSPPVETGMSPLEASVTRCNAVADIAQSLRRLVSEKRCPNGQIDHVTGDPVTGDPVTDPVTGDHVNEDMHDVLQRAEEALQRESSTLMTLVHTFDRTSGGEITDGDSTDGDSTVRELMSQLRLLTDPGTRRDALALARRTFERPVASEPEPSVGAS